MVPVLHAEVLAEKAVERESPLMTGQVLRFMRPMLADLRPAAMSELWRPLSSKTMPKMELILHGNEVRAGDAASHLAWQLCILRCAVMHDVRRPHSWDRQQLIAALRISGRLQ